MHTLPRDLHIAKAERHLRHHAHLDVALPLRALLLDAYERLVEVGHMHTGAQVFAGEPAQAAALRACHVARLAARTERRNHFAQRPLEHRPLEPVERITDPAKQQQVVAKFVDRLERPHARLRDQLVTALEQERHLALVQALCERVRVGGLPRGVERDAVPGRIVGSEAKLAEPGGQRQLLRGTLTVGGDRGERGHLEPGASDQRRVGGADAGQLPQGVERADAKLWMLPRQRTAIVKQDRPQANECLVDLGERRCLGLFVAPDGTDQVALQRGRGHGQAREPNLCQAQADALECGAPRAHHEHALVVGNERTDRVDDGLRATRAGERGDGERTPGRNRRDHGFLLIVGVEQQRVVRR